MKRIFTFFFALLSACTFSAYAAIVDGTCGDNLTWTLNTKDSTLVIFGTGEMTNYVSSSVPWSDYKIYIKYVTLPDGLTSIGYRAFYSCSALTSVTIPNSVTSIGHYAFNYCSGLTSVTIPNSVTSIGVEAFSGCSSLTSVTIPNSVTSIGNSAFYSCESLTSVTIGNSVTSIKGNAFAYCYNLTSIVVEEGNTIYDSRENCSAIIETATNTLIRGCQNTIIPNSVTSIGNYAFSGCYKMTSVTIPNSVTSIGDHAFVYCDGLTSITIPNSVTSIGYGAFSYCSSLTSITIPYSVTSIGEGAFEGTNLTSFICYNPSLTYFGLGTQPLLDTIVAPAAFFDVEEADWASAPKHVRYARVIAGELTENAFGVIHRSYKTLKVLDLEAATNTSIADEAFKGCYKLDSLYLPSNLTYIPYMAIADCKSLKSITIPATVEEIDNSAFENCRSLQSIIFEDSASAQGPAHYAAASGSSLWRIGSWAFYNCHQLQELTIPEGVTEIGDAAFYGCTYIEDIVLP